MELLNGLLKGWRVKPPKFDSRSGEMTEPSMVACTIEIPTSKVTVDTLRKITESGELVEVALSQVQTSLGLANTDRTDRQREMDETTFSARCGKRRISSRVVVSDGAPVIPPIA